MVTAIDSIICCGCQACAQACPKNSIRMCRDEEGFLYPKVDADTCVHCGLCEKVCPELHAAEVRNEVPETYVAYNLNEEERFHSSSGGIFTLLAKSVLERGGVVYGAAMEHTLVKHIRVCEIEKLYLLRGSKYVQSDINGTYLQTRDDLKNGKMVLFTGTPCQIEGLKAFLGKEYENLITMDIICHGVPSPMVWEKYVALREKEAGASVEKVVFRDKKNGWSHYSVCFEFLNHTTYTRSRHKDPFMQAFLRDLCLRPSCYQCSFKKVSRVSDITVADFWGVENVCPERNDDRGMSLLMLHSAKGKNMLAEIAPGMRYQQVPFEASISGNAAMICSAQKPRYRDKFMKEVSQENFAEMVAKYAGKPLTVKAAVKRILKKTGVLDMAKLFKRMRKM